MGDEVKNRFDRIVAILTQLQSSRVMKAQDLADRFQVSLRTIYRDIRSLEEAGVPVSGEAGVGYSLMDGYRLPPVMFTREEAASFVAAEKLMQKFTDKKVAASYGAAMFKIRSVLRGNLKDHVDALETQIWTNPTEELIAETTPDSLGILFESIAEKKQVRLEYQAFESEHSALRDIEPVGLFHAENNWNLMAYCHLRNDYRQFRTDRIKNIMRLDAAFTREHPSIDTFRKAEWLGADYRVVIRVDKDVCKYLRAGKKYYGIVDEKIIGNQIEMTFMTKPDGEGLARWFMMFGDCAEVVEPVEFRNKVAGIAKEIVDRTSR
ncbi:MAG: YafY family transcriptional regulator [Chitinophagaceae bacterium]|nr:MAG: YafY family transcriptional regulator [Chitinophagaceae bacterium]